MINSEILKFCAEKGFLVDKELLEMLGESQDIESIKFVLEKVRTYTCENILTKRLFEKNKEQVNKILLDLPEEKKKNLEKIRVKLGLSIEISKEQYDLLSNSGEIQLYGFSDGISGSVAESRFEITAKPIKTGEGIKIIARASPEIEEDEESSAGIIARNFSYAEEKNIKSADVPVSISLNREKTNAFEKNINILSYNPKNTSKPEVKDFVEHFRRRFTCVKEILQGRFELDNLVSIDKLSGVKRNISIIGMVYSKSITKNNNIILDVEDLTGKVKIIVSKSKEDLYKIAEEICPDSILGFRCSGNGEALFANGIFFPDSAAQEKKKSPVEEYAIFIGDLHFGSKLFLKKSFLKFLDYLNGNLEGYGREEIKKIKYLFIVGDIVTGIGNYPEQEKDLEVSDLEEQFIGLSSLLERIPEHIKIVISPGNHDGVRVMEPQPVFDAKYAWPLYQLRNVIPTENPCLLNFGAQENFSGFDILTYHGFSYPYYAGSVPELIKKRAMNSPEEIMKYLLKHRHLAPTHGSTQYYPHKDDPMFIKSVPDIFVSGHTHKCGVSSYNNILIISTSCWEAMTPYQEKFGNEPDHCKVPMLNLKTRAVKILDFEEK